MASHFSDIGFHFDSKEDMEDFLGWAFFEQSRELRLPWGRVALYQQENGLQYWFPLNEDGEALDQNFHFASSLRNKISILSCIVEDVAGQSGLYHCEIDLDEGDGYTIPEVPINLYLPAAGYLGPFEPGLACTAQLACYAETLTVYDTLEAHGVAIKSGEAIMAAESFIPSGTFGLEGDTAFKPSSRAIISGVVEGAERLNNSATGLPFDHLQVRSLGIRYDVLADPRLYDALPQPGAVVEGQFWMTALVWPEEGKAE